MRRSLLTTCALTVAAALATPACGQESPPAAKPGDAPQAPKAGGASAAAPAPAPRRDDGEYKKTASGLEYQVLAAGKGTRMPKPGDGVQVTYKGWRDDGFVFDESARHGGSVCFPVGGLIEGWNEALAMMTAGAKWKLRIPPILGYGAQGMGQEIPPNSTLNFELELLDVFTYVKPVPEAQKSTPTGLKYEVLAEGAGDPPAATDSIEVRFAFFGPAGKFVDASPGAVKSRPVDMRLPFLKEALLLMKAGSKYRFEVPPALAFGAQSPGPAVPANSVTYWDVELVKVVVIKPLKVPDFEAIDETKFKKLASGLMVQALKEGEGPSPKLGDNVKVHYAGWLTDGTPFDSSYSRGEPAEFRLGGVIAGWNEGLQLMKPGAVYRFVIPANLAYGKQAMGDVIKPDSTLVFHIELISFSK